MICPNCGNPVADNAKVCMSCGVAIKKPTNGLAIAALVVGILGFLCCTWLAPVAIVLGAISLSKEKNTMAIIGLVLGILGILWWIFSAIFMGPIYTEMLNSLYYY